MLDRPQALADIGEHACNRSGDLVATPDACSTVHASAAAPSSAGSSAICSFAFALPRTSAPCAALPATRSLVPPTRQASVSRWIVAWLRRRTRRCAVARPPAVALLDRQRDRLRQAGQCVRATDPPANHWPPVMMRAPHARHAPGPDGQPARAGARSAWLWRAAALCGMHMSAIQRVRAGQTAGRVQHRVASLCRAGGHCILGKVAPPTRDRVL